MPVTPTTLILDESGARRLLLVRAIETADTGGRLVSAAEREQIEQAALAATGDPARGETLDPAAYLRARAQRWLDAARQREPRLAQLEHPPRWQAWLTWALPVAALLLGAALDRIGNAQQVNLLSPPLLGFVFWNVAVYLILVAGWAWSLRGEAPMLPAMVGRWGGRSAQRSSGHLRTDIGLQFRRHWLRTAAPLEAMRWKAVLHASAAAWALGVALSIVGGGLVREYRVGWESTFLDLGQVHAFLRTLFSPVVAVLPLEPFTMAELERMHFRSGVQVARTEAQRWVGLYLGLLGLVVMLPRLLLAGQAAWRRRQMTAQVALDLQDGYYEEVLGRVSPAVVQLCLLRGPPEANQALQQVVTLLAERPVTSAALSATPVLSTARGDTLCWLELPGNSQPPAAVPRARGWRAAWARWRPAAADAAGVPQVARQSDVVLCPVAGPSDLESAAAMLQWLGRPVVVLPVEPGHEGAQETLRATVARLGLAAHLLPLQEGCATWWHEAVLQSAIARQLPAHKAPGMARIAQAWQARHEARLAESMRLLAEELLLAARDSQVVAAGPLDLRRLVRPAEREADTRARDDARHALQQRLRERHLRSSEQLLRLHLLDVAQAKQLAEPQQAALVLRQGVDAPQAGAAGAASGAALGATVDLMVGGLTLGAAAALGAVLGGGSAYIAAAWKNRSAPGGSTLVQLGDDMLEGLAVDALQRYLTVVHSGRTQGIGQEGAADVTLRWQQALSAALQARREELAPLWRQARLDAGEPLPVTQLAQGLAEVAVATLARVDVPSEMPLRAAE